MDSLHDFAQKYLTTRAAKLTALADAAAARGDLELAALYRVEFERKIEILKPDLRVVVDPGSTTSS